ncbi:MAG: hypothetical protein RIR00_667 [Pseudomonadota bacterium]
MRALVFLLVLANLLFFAYDQGYFGRPENPDAQRISNQINPEQVRIVGRNDGPDKATKAGDGEKPAEKPAEHATAAEAPAASPAAAPAAVAPAAVTPAVAAPAAATAVASAAATAAPSSTASTPPAAAAKPAASAAAAPAAPAKPLPTCLVWNAVPANIADRMQDLFGKQFADLKTSRRIPGLEGGNWWVYIPPLPSRAEAERKVAELQRFGVNDYFIMTEAGPNRFAISLGVFSSELAATDRLNALQAVGVKNAKLGQRGRELPQSIEIRGSGERVQAARQAIAQPQRAPQLKAQECP